MNKRIILYIIMLLCLLVRPPGAGAVSASDPAWETGLPDIADVPEAAEEILDGLERSELTPEQAAGRLLGALGNGAGNAFRDALGSLGLLLCVMLVCGICGAVREGANASGETLHVAASVAVTTICAGGMTGLITRAGDAIADMSLYAQTLVPAMAMLQSAMGQPGAAVARHSATMLFSGILSGMIRSVMFPLTYVYILLLAVNAALPRPTLARMASFIKKSVMTVLTISLTLFVAYFTVSGAVAGSADAMAVKSARVSISAAIPVVGGILAEASEALLLGGGMVKNTIGLFGLLAIAGIILEPFLGLAARWILFKLGAALSAPLADERISGLLDGLSDAFGMVMGMTAACAFLLFVSVLAMMLAGGVG